MGNVAIFKGKLVKFLAKAGILMPARVEAERSASPTSGETAFNTSVNKLEYYNGTAWVQLDSAAAIDPTDVAGIPPSLDLNFSGDGLPSTVTFSRNSIGTYFSQDGYLKTASANAPRIEYDPITRNVEGLLIEESRVNLLTNTEHFDANWFNSRTTNAKNAEIAPDGSLTMTKLVETITIGAHYTRSTGVTITANTTYNISIFAKAGERTKIRISLLDTVTAANGINLDVDLSNGTITGTSVNGLGSLTPNSAKIENVGNGIYRISVSGIIDSSSTSARMWISILDATGNPSYTGDGKSGFYIWGAQLEAGAFLTSYVPSAQTFTSRASSATYYDASGIIQSASTNVARNTYNPSPDKLHLPSKLLLETQATNNFLQSENLAVSWTLIRSTQSSSTQATPDGNTTSKSIVLTNDGTSGSVFARQAYTTTANTAFTISSYVKIPTTGIAFNGIARIEDETEAGQALFTLTSKSISLSGTCISANIQELPNGWYRVSATFLPTTASSHNVVPYGFLSNGTSESMWCWGAQLETGYCPTSYIPTTTTTVIRSADVYASASVTRQADSAVMIGSNFTGWYRWDEGTIFVEADDSKGLTGRFVNIVTPTSDTNNYIVLGQSTGSTTNGILVNTVTQAAISTPIVYGTTYKRAFSYTFNSAAAAMDGVIIGTASPQAFPTTVSVMSIGGGYSSSTRTIVGHIRRIIFWPKRIDNDKLQLMTR